MPDVAQLYQQAPVIVILSVERLNDPVRASNLAALCAYHKAPPKKYVFQSRVRAPYV